MTKLYTFEFKKEGLSFSGKIQSIDWRKNIAFVEITEDGKSYWKESFDSDGKNEKIPVSNLLTETEKVSSFSYSELEKMLKETYGIKTKQKRNKLR